MAITYSETVLFVEDPARATKQLIEALGWDVIERVENSWILLATPGGGKIGYILHVPNDSERWPNPMIAFKSDQIDDDIADLKSKGLLVSDVVKADHMWHASYVDHHGNKYLIWQEPDK